MVSGDGGNAMGDRRLVVREGGGRNMVVVWGD